MPEVHAQRLVKEGGIPVFSANLKARVVVTALTISASVPSMILVHYTYH
jgi:hypothetical protein